MKKMKFLSAAVGLLLASLAAVAQTANMQDRGLWGSIAVPPGKDAINIGDYTQHNGKVLLTWRMLPGDDENTSFNLWRKMGENGSWSCVNDAFKTGKKGIKATNYQHNALSTITGDIYYRLTYGDQKTADNYIGEYKMTQEQAKAKIPYVSIPLKATDDCSDYPDKFKYQANDCSVGDLDGDGQMEIVVKRLLTVYDANGNITATSEGAADTDPQARHIAIFDAYKLDGTFLWRVKSGPNIIAGNSINFAVADLDGDGCAEVVTKTGEGTVFGDGDRTFARCYVGYGIGVDRVPAEHEQLLARLMGRYAGERKLRTITG